MMRLCWCALLALIISNASASDGQGFVDRFCIACHDGQTQDTELRLDRVVDLPTADQRQVWWQALRKLKSHEMPPPDSVQPDAIARETFNAWVIENFGIEDATSIRDHWSLRPVIRPMVPAIGADHPIDAFIIEALRDAGLQPSPRTDRRTLLRRVTLDLTGLLPTPEESLAFIQDDDDFETAYARVVDKLLASPHYGERWAQHWLDVIRWAETVGFETNAERRDAWHYRDWVIRSFNLDLPYDDFLTEQLIGDSSNEDAALGFLVAGPANLPGQIGRDEEAMRQARQDELDEVIQTVGQGFFGLTIGCARCHDHKFDPISQRDYYAMQAVFAGLQYGYRRLHGPQNDLWTAQVPEARERLDQSYQQLESIRARHSLRAPLGDVHTDSFSPVATDAVRMEIQATNAGAASLHEFQIWSIATGNKESYGKEPQNVALAVNGAIPSASSFALANQTRHFENLVDGSVDQRQAFPWVADSIGPAWIQIDLPKDATIDRITWHGGSSIPVEYEIKVRDHLTKNWTTVAHTRDRMLRIDDRRTRDQITIENLTPTDIDQLAQLITRIRQQEQELNRLQAGPQTYAASFSEEVAPTMLLRRGDPMQPVDEVIAAVPAVLADPPIRNPEHEFQRRQMLAEHLIRPDHPLTARVFVNRVWQHHFGAGLVETSSDFGRMGALPTHPALLDWLAAEFVEHGWSIKHIHRMMVTSQTYTQSSQPSEQAIALDAESRLLWRFPPRRLEAESIRDSILMASGKLNTTMYGRGFDFFQQRGGLSDYRAKEVFDIDGWRRMVYAHKIRMQSVNVFGAFDCPDAGQMMPRRNQSITPIQSLGLLNSPFVDRQSDYFAERLLALTTGRGGGDLAEAIRLGFDVALSRPPTDRELPVLIRLAEQHGLKQVCRVLFNTSEFLFLQ